MDHSAFVTHRDDTLNHIIDVDFELLAPGIPRAVIGGCNSYPISLKQIARPIAYGNLTWKTGRP